MKQRLLAAALAVAVMLSCVSVAWAGSSADPLVSLSYLNTTYLPGLRTTVEGAVRTAIKPIYDGVLARLGINPAPPGRSCPPSRPPRCQG